MATVSPLLRDALNRHRAGDLRGADALYRALLTRSPDDAEAWHLRGLLVHQCGRPLEAVIAIGRAIALAPGVALYRANLARVLAALGRIEEAHLALGAALALDSQNPDLHYDIGVLAARLGRLEEAIHAFGNAVALLPTHARAHNNLGSALEARGQWDAAESHFRAAIGGEPRLAEAHANLGALLCRRGRPEAAEASLRQALALAPDFPEALNTLATVLAARRDQPAAEALLRRALAIDPAYAEAHNNLGVALTGRGSFDAALAALRSALRLRPGYAEAETNLGNALVALGRTQEALAAYRRALKIAPDEAETHYNLGVALLLAGRLAEGFARYEKRFERRGAAQRSLPPPLWAGEAIGERVLFVHAEQGFGDAIQFCRFVPLVQAQRVILEVPPPLVRLFGTLARAPHVIARGAPVPHADLRCPLMSLPHRLRTTLETIPATTPYLFAPPVAAGEWRERLRRYPGFKVGLAWAGNPEYPADARRSIPRPLIAPLLEVPGACFVSLQPGPSPADMPILSFPGALGDFADTAALITALDLVISVDTAVVHLAGALGKRVWLLNRFDTCWRWLLGRTDSPWYPSLRQFRQQRPEDWSGVVAAARQALVTTVAERARRGT
ncbi:MAG: tetratricopeptide repeat protein [Acetobacteraceae bacterium]